MKPLFLRLLLGNSLFGCALAAGAVAYNGHLHPAAIAALVAVLAAYAALTGVCLYLAWNDRRGRLLEDVGELGDKLPGLALLGTGVGFLIALSGSTADVQHRVTGASSGILATIVGVACWVAISVQHWALARRGETP